MLILGLIDPPGHIPRCLSLEKIVCVLYLRSIRERPEEAGRKLLDKADDSEDVFRDRRMSKSEERRLVS